MKVIKLSTTREAAIWVTPEQLQKLNDASVTLRSSVGDAYCQSHGATERHAITMNEDLVFSKAFRRVTKETYGLEAHMSLIKKAEALISSGWKPN